MSKIGEFDSKSHESIILEASSISVDHSSELIKKEQRIADEICATALHERDGEVTKEHLAGVCCQIAHQLREGGDIERALSYFIEAADLGSQEAKMWIGDYGLPHREDRKAVQISEPKMDIRGSAVTVKFLEILKKLHAQNPKEYAEETIQKIEGNFKIGHCNGFRAFFTQLCLTKHPETGLDRMDEYDRLMRDILTFEGELLEPPLGTSYKDFEANLSSEQKKDLALTNQIKEIIQFIRFAQQVLYESNGCYGLLQQNRDVFSWDSQTNVKGILGEQYYRSEGYPTFNWFADIESFMDTLSVYLTCDNIAWIDMAMAAEEAHAIAIFMRAGAYYLYDVNTKSLEDNYDPRYSALQFGTLSAAREYLLTKYEKYAQVKEPGDGCVFFVERGGRVQNYPTCTQEEDRLKFLETVRALKAFKLNGQKLKEIQKKIFETALKFAAEGNVDAEYQLAECYEKGEGTDLDLSKALEYYERAAKQGHEGAIEALKRLEG
jgi:TPR repeat protein